MPGTGQHKAAGRARGLRQLLARLWRRRAARLEACEQRLEACEQRLGEYNQAWGAMPGLPAVAGDDVRRHGLHAVSRRELPG
jgi:hypothetical protein